MVFPLRRWILLHTPILNAMHFHPIHLMQSISNVYSNPYPTHGILHRRKNDLHITILTTHGSPHQKTQSFTMTDYVKPEQMDTVQKMKYMSIVSKVCKELDTHLGFSEKSVAEVNSDCSFLIVVFDCLGRWFVNMCRVQQETPLK